jgi:hypothetical protein
MAVDDDDEERVHVQVGVGLAHDVNLPEGVGSGVPFRASAHWI